MNLRLANASDIPAMMELERQSPAAAHWTEQQYRQIFDPSGASAPRRLALVIAGKPEAPAKLESRADSGLLGFLVARHSPPDWELENIVVAPAARRKGLATRLMKEFLTHAREAKGESMFLEVRESNHAARALYEHWAFKETGRRKDYYADESEDAILYRRALP